MKTKNKKSSWRQSIEDLERITAHIEKTGKLPDEVKMTHRKGMASIPEPQEYNPVEVRALRDKLGATQATFAKLIGVSMRLVSHWEQGLRKPAPIACRMLETIERDLRPWTAMLKSA